MAERWSGTDPIPWIVAIENLAKASCRPYLAYDMRADLAGWTMAPLDSFAFRALNATCEALEREANAAWPDNMETVRACRRISEALRVGTNALLQETTVRQDLAFFGRTPPEQNTAHALEWNRVYFAPEPTLWERFANWLRGRYA